MILKNNNIDIPIIMFHSVGNTTSSWQKKWLSVSIIHFEEFCKYLVNKKYDTLFLDEWYYFQNKAAKIRNKNIVITFDDGYLDNWVYALPILKKYGLKATLFINPEFIDPTAEKRPTLEDVWNGKISIGELNTLGYLNWQEIRRMNNSGWVDIQSHTMSHNYYFYTDTLIDYYAGQNEYHWLAWIERPDRKARWITENQSNLIPSGYPIFEYDRSLKLRRFIPSKHFIDSFIEKYNKLIYNNNDDIKEQLFAFTTDYRNKYTNMGRYESDEERNERYRYEIYESKRLLENNLNKKVEFLCWPGGAYNDVSIQMSNDAGYKASTLASWDKRDMNRNNHSYKRMRRFGISSFIKVDRKYKYNNNTKHLIHNYLSKQGNSYYKNLARLKKIFLLLTN